MTRSCINICLFAVISLFVGVIWQGSAYAAMPEILPLQQITDGLQGPSRVAVDAVGNLYVANASGKNIVKFDKYGTRDQGFASVEISGLGLAVAADSSAIYASAGDKVVVLDAGGNLQGYLGAGAGEFQNAGVIALGVNNELIVADTLTRQVRVFPAAGGSSLLLGGGFGGVTGIAVDSATGDIYVADPIFEGTQTPQLYVYYSDYSPKAQLDAATAFGARLQFFGGLSFDSVGRLLYVADAESGSIRVLELPSAVQGAFDASGEIVRPESIVYDPLTKRLFVVWAGIRVDVYGVAGGTTPVKANVSPSIPQAITVGEVSSQTPALLFANATDADSDVLTYSVRVFDAAGGQVAVFGVAEGTSPTVANVSEVLTENASYTWQVQADDGLTTSGWSAPQAIYVNADQEAPAAPGLTSFVNGETAGSDAVLTWSASADADPFASVKYRVEIYEGASLLASTLSAETSSMVTSYSAFLTPGATYAWRVAAVDNTALETVSTNTGSFVFQASVLTVKSSVDGAKVYLGGHHGYAGRYLGVAPVEVRGLVEGDYSIVVEAAGFQPYVVTVPLAKDSAAEVVAELKGTRLATRFVNHDLNLAGLALQGTDVAPIIADLNQDGTLDLLLADNGELRLYLGSLALEPQISDTIEDLSAVQADSLAAAASRVVFDTTAQLLGLPKIAGAAPCLVDWNNDSRLDLLVGGADGSVNLFLGDGSPSFFSAAGQWLVTVVSQAIPAVADLDADGDKDLVVASGNDLLLFDNVGSDATPELNAQSTLATLTSSAVPFFADWNADGERELMLLSQGELFQADMRNGLVASLTSTGLSVAGSGSVFALNFADSNYADLVFGTASGALVVANGQQGGFAPAYKEALLAKLADVELAVLDQAPELIGKVANIASRIGRGKYESAFKKAEELVGLLGSTTPAGIVVNEFAGILK